MGLKRAAISDPHIAARHIPNFDADELGVRPAHRFGATVCEVRSGRRFYAIVRHFDYERTQH